MLKSITLTSRLNQYKITSTPENPVDIKLDAISHSDSSEISSDHNNDMISVSNLKFLKMLQDISMM